MTRETGSGSGSRYPYATNAIWVSVAMVAFVVLTPMLVGVTSSRVLDDLGISVTGLGVATTAFWVTTAISAFVLAPYADRWGWRFAGAVGLALTALAQVFLGLLNFNFVTFMLLMVLSGVAYGLVTPTSNLAVVRDVPERRRGLAIGAKQAAAPLAGVVAGAVAPMVILMLGWRWVFVFAGLLTAIAAMITALSPAKVEEPTSARQRRRGSGRSTRGLLVLAFAGALATVPVSVLSTFSVLTLETSGLSLSASGYIVAVASLIALSMRLAGGIWIDRTGSDGLSSAALLVAIGAVSTLAMATGQLWLVIAGTILAFSAGWGWPGLLLVGILRRFGAEAARATGRFQVGTAVGAAVGPMIYVSATAVAGGGAHGMGWAAVSVVTVPAVVLILWARKAMGPSEPLHVALDQAGGD